MGAFHEKEIQDILDNSYEYAKPLKIYCPKVTCVVGKEVKTYHDITQVFDDFEEGKVMGRIWKFGKEKSRNEH